MNKRKKVKPSKVKKLGPAMLLAGLLLIYQASMNNLPGRLGTHLVTEIIDGDTMVTEDKSIIRLFGLDAPEPSLCGGEEAKKAITEQLLNQRISYNTKVRDARGRQLALVYIGKRLVNIDLLKTGWYDFSGGNTDGRELLQEAYRYVKDNKIGIYSEKCSQTENKENPKCLIKGNISTNGYGKLYYFPGCSRYGDIIVDLWRGEDWFCSEKEAVAAGFAKSENCYEKKY